MEAQHNLPQRNVRLVLLGLFNKLNVSLKTYYYYYLTVIHTKKISYSLS